MKTYLGLSRDHTGSMGSLTRAAMADYNDQLQTIKDVSSKYNQDTIVSVVTIGVGRSGIVGREVVNSNVQILQSLTSYPAAANSTPLFDSVVELVNIMKSVPDVDDPTVAFTIVVTTDGGDNSSRTSGPQLAKLIAELQATDRWTFVFRVPKGYAKTLTKLGIPDGNIYEWDQTTKGVQASTQATVAAYDSFFQGRSAGKTSTRSFYANLEDVSVEEVKAQLVDISNQVQFYPVSVADSQRLIREVVEEKIGEAMVRGGAFYQLVKAEKQVQANKRIIIRDKATGSVYSGDAARQMLALPKVGTVKLTPDNLANFEVFIQSTSTNRKLDAGTTLVYWRNVGVAYKEGPSAR